MFFSFYLFYFILLPFSIAGHFGELASGKVPRLFLRCFFVDISNRQSNLTPEAEQPHQLSHRHNESPSRISAATHADPSFVAHPRSALRCSFRSESGLLCRGCYPKTKSVWLVRRWFFVRVASMLHVRFQSPAYGNVCVWLYIRIALGIGETRSKGALLWLFAIATAYGTRYPRIDESRGFFCTVMEVFCTISDYSTKRD